MKRDLKFTSTYPYPPERVWRALADSRAVAEWLMPNDFEPRLGHKFQFKSKPVGGWDGIVNCEVLECDPPRRLVYSWKSNMLDTVVAWTLERTAEGTRLTLEHTGFAGMKALMISFVVGSGWKGILEKGIRAAAGRVDEQGNYTPGAATTCAK